MEITSGVDYQIDNTVDAESFDFKTSIEDFSVEFSIAALSDAVGLDEDSIDQREAILRSYSEECKSEIRDSEDRCCLLHPTYTLMIIWATHGRSGNLNI